MGRDFPPRVLVPAIFALIVAIGCGGSSSSNSPTAKTASGKRVDPATAASIVGRVMFEGAAPAPATVNTSADSACASSGKTVRNESVIVDNGALENVFISIKDGLISDGLTGYAFDVPTAPIELDQNGCVYVPHVLGIRVGQPLKVLNNDPTGHNVHAAAKVNDQINTSQPFKGMAYTHSFSKPEVMVPFKCDIHPWMLAWVGVVDHPYFAVSGNGGQFELKNVPPGTYTIQAWHERFGTQAQKVTLGDKETRQITFTFKAS